MSCMRCAPRSPRGSSCTCLATLFTRCSPSWCRRSRPARSTTARRSSCRCSCLTFSARRQRRRRLTRLQTQCSRPNRRSPSPRSSSSPQLSPLCQTSTSWCRLCTPRCSQRPAAQNRSKTSRARASSTAAPSSGSATTAPPTCSRYASTCKACSKRTFRRRHPPPRAAPSPPTTTTATQTPPPRPVRRPTARSVATEWRLWAACSNRRMSRASADPSASHRSRANCSPSPSASSSACCERAASSPPTRRTQASWSRCCRCCSARSAAIRTRSSRQRCECSLAYSRSRSPRFPPTRPRCSIGRSHCSSDRRACAVSPR
mmetsp:Transcript_17812/g.37706  ORF Transcript_17812/g.37706 Transcript_17812/m.37706 type:complete len:317 (-) Transcript_17812:2602-3552(-)